MSWLARRIPTAPVGFNKEQFFAGIRWHQKWQLFQGIFTPGVNAIEEMCEDLTLPKNLSGKRVLDVGAWHGCLSFECERRGAREVVALSPEDPQQTGFNKLRDILHSNKVHYVRGTVYDLNPRQLGYFDVVLFCGVLYHLRYPLLGIDNIRRVCKGDVYVETAVSEVQLKLQETCPELLSAPLWLFYRFDELNADTSNWFAPNCTAVVQAFESAGFETQVLKRSNRATFHGKLKEGLPEFLTIGTTEGVYYDTVASHLLGKDKLGHAPGAASAHGQSFSQQFLKGVLTSKEYYQENGNNDQDWVSSLYTRLLSHAARHAEASLPFRKAFDDDLAYRQAVVEHILTSTEYRINLVAVYYALYLGRKPSPDDISHWVAVLMRGASPEYLQAEFLGSDEYFKNQGGSNRRWLDAVYTQLLDKIPASVKEIYQEALDVNLATRAEIVTAIVESLEYRHRLIQKISGAFLNRPYSGELSHSLGHSRPSAA
jgi:tRNA (mo5U34)-methyltransferase